MTVGRALARTALAVALATSWACGAPEETPPEEIAEQTKDDAEPTADASEPAPDESRLVIELAPGQGQREIEETAARFFADPVVELLFPGVADADLERFWLVRGAPLTDLGPWDLAYAFKEAGSFAKVEPNQSDTLGPETRRQQVAGLCDLGGDQDNPDEAWALRKMRAEQAWARVPATSAGRRFGEGVRICHPDTGWAEHSDLDPTALDLTRAWNLIRNDANAQDPLRGSFPLNPGHGTATGSVIASRGGIASGQGTTGPGRVTGVAPGATLVPLRTVDSVIQVFDSDVARAVARGVKSDCGVISMSLGGRAFFGLRAAVRHAANQGLIVVAAAGNCVGMVVAPAIYPDVIAVAATDDVDAPWGGSSRGPAVDIAAPGEDVWCASRSKPEDPVDQVATGSGTSFATAELAGAAALWIAFHGRAALEQAAGGRRIKELFLHLVGLTARRPSGWDPRRYGSGILDLDALLAADLDIEGPRLTPPEEPSPTLSLLASMLERPVPETQDAVRVMLGDPQDLDAAFERFAAELMEMALRDPGAFRRAVAAALAPPADANDGRPRAEARAGLSALASETLRSALE